MLRLPLSVPAAVGKKVTWTEHESPATKVVPQLFVSANLASADMASSSFVPPVLVIVTVWAGLVVPISSLVNVRLAGETVSDVGKNSYAPRSTTLFKMRGLPSRSVVGRLGALLVPKSMAGEPD